MKQTMMVFSFFLSFFFSPPPARARARAREEAPARRSISFASFATCPGGPKFNDGRYTNDRSDDNL